MTGSTIDTYQPVKTDNQLDFVIYTRFYRLFLIGVGLTTVAYILLYWRTNAAQLVGGVIITIIGSFFTFLGYLLARRQQYTTSSIFAIIGITVVIAGPLLVFDNAEGYLLASGFLIISLFSFTVFTRWSSRLAAIMLFLTVSIITAGTNAFVRFDINNSPALRFLLSAFTIIVGLLIVWRLIRTLRISSIRARLIASFAAVAIIPLVIAAGAASSIGTKATEDSAVDLLSTVIDLKEAAINTWLLDLNQTIHNENNTDTDGVTIASLFIDSPVGSSNNTIYDVLLQRLRESLNKNEDLQEYLILDRQGKVILSTELDHLGTDLSGTRFFVRIQGGESIGVIEEIDNFGSVALFLSEPIYNQTDQPVGVLVGRADLDRLTSIMQEGGVIGETGETYIVTSDFTLLTDSRFPGYESGGSQVMTRGAFDAILGERDGAGFYENYQGVEVIGAYRWLPDMGVAMFAEQSRAEIFSPTILTIVVNSMISLVLIAGAIIFGLLISNSIGRPLANLTNITQQISTGDLSLIAPVSKKNDEISKLAASFNQMTLELRKLVGELEQRVLERTNELESRNKQLILASQLSSTITSILDSNELVRQVVNLIRDHFNLYYVGLFLVDDVFQFAVLKAGTGEAGQQMLARNHRINLNEGMIGWSIKNALARIAQQAGEDPVRLTTPYLPETRSEAAIPLRSRGQVIGALTIQSEQTNAFDEATLTTFQTMADQIAVAIDNSRLFVEAQQSIETTKRAYGELSRRAWLELINSRPIQAKFNEQGITITNPDLPNTTSLLDVSLSLSHSNSNNKFRVPIMVRGTEIGFVNAQKPDHADDWSEDEIEMLETLTEQLGIALESARLFEETLTRAERERLINQIANRVRDTLDIDTVLKTSIIELQAAMDLQEVEVRMAQKIDQENWQ